MKTYSELQSLAETWADAAADDCNKGQYRIGTNAAAIALVYAQLAANALYDQRVPYKPTGRFGPG